MNWTPAQYQSIYQLLATAWPQPLSDEAWHEFHRVAQRYPGDIAYKAIQNVNEAQQGKDFRPALGTFVTELRALDPPSTLVPLPKDHQVQSWEEFKATTLPNRQLPWKQEEQGLG